MWHTHDLPMQSQPSLQTHHDQALAIQQLVPDHLSHIALMQNTLTVPAQHPQGSPTEHQHNLVLQQLQNALQCTVALHS